MSEESVGWAGFLTGFMANVRILCGSCTKDEHACGGECDCDRAFCMQRREILGVELPAESRRSVT